MKVFLVLCFLTITFFSQGWGGKHYLVKTKDKGKYEPGPEAGHDYNDYENEDEDVYNDPLNAVDTYDDDDAYDDDTNDDDTYHDANEEELDVESMIEDNLGEDAVKEYEGLGEEDQDEAIRIIKDAAENRKNNNNEDFDNKLGILEKILKSAHGFLEAILAYLKSLDISTIRRYTTCSSRINCKRRCRKNCKERYSRSSERSQRKGSNKQSSKYRKIRTCKSNCYSNCKRDSSCRRTHF